MGWDTAANILNDALAELGLRSSDLSEPYDSTDQNVILLRRLLKGLGRDLVRDRAWTHLQKVHTFATVDGTAAYDLPADFARMLDQTGWNRTDALPLGGPVSPQGWQVLKSSAFGGVVDFYFRVYGGQFHLHPTPSSVETVAFEYVATSWVGATAATATTDEPTAGTEYVHFDPRLMVLGLKWRFRREKGLDSTAAEQDYRDALGRAESADGAAPVLRLGSRGLDFGRLIDGANVPETGFGS